MITIATKSAIYDPNHKVLTQFVTFLLWKYIIIYYFPVSLIFRDLFTRSPKHNKCKVVSGNRVTLPVNFACKPGPSYNPLDKVTLAVGLPPGGGTPL